MTDGDDPGKVFITQPVPKSMQERAVDMLFQQGPLVIVLSVACYLMYNTLMTSIPQHILAINAGNAEISRLDREGDLVVAKQHLDAVKAIVDGAKDSQDRLERVLTRRIDINERHVGEVKQKVDALTP